MAFGHLHVSKVSAKKRGEDLDEPASTRRMRYALSGSFSYIPKRIRTELRGSSLPFCPILYIDGELKNIEGYLQEPSVSWRNQFYLELGTTAHTLWQRVLTRAAPESPVKVKPFGSWRCSHCLKKEYNCFLPGPHECGNASGAYTRKEFILLRKYQDDTATMDAILNEYDNIGGIPEWEYVEVSVSYKGLSCHIDYIEYYPGEDKWVVWDLKTATTKAVSNPQSELPVAKNVLQIETYAYLLPICLPEHIPRIDEYNLLYHTRESATTWEPYRVDWTPARIERTGKRVKRWVAGLAAANYYLDDTTNPDSLQEVVSLRPCLSEKSYLREMGCKFEMGGRCKFVGSCTNYESAALVSKLTQQLSESLKNHVNLLRRGE